MVTRFCDSTQIEQNSSLAVVLLLTSFSKIYIIEVAQQKNTQICSNESYENWFAFSQIGVTVSLGNSSRFRRATLLSQTQPQWQILIPIGFEGFEVGLFKKVIVSGVFPNQSTARTSVIISRGLYTFYPILEDFFRKFCLYVWLKFS